MTDYPGTVARFARETACGWNPAEATTDCDWDRDCPIHGAEPDLDATVAAVGALPMPVGDEEPVR
ncbi:hypothetical protein [Streptomyces sp. NPDC096324]|uniref:hypothetical protein n=1 Tax=Streptomyces sp. NPDC096324 TaxID=3366085 RepID=UPI0037F53B53